MSRNKTRVIEPASRPHTIWRRGATVMLPALIVVGLLVWHRDRPRRLLRDARAIAQTDPAKADELFEQCVAAAGGSFPAAQLERTLLFAEQRHWPEALGCFSQIDKPGQCDVSPLVRLAKLALAERSDYLAELALNAARRPGPMETEVLRLSIPFHERLGRVDNVLADCTRLAELDSADPMPWLVIGRIHNRNREVPEALDAYQKARDRHLDGADLNETRNDMAELYLHEGNLPAARIQLEQLRAARVPTVSDRLKWTHLLRLEGDFAAALKEIEIVLQQFPSNVNALELRGTIELDSDRADQAVADFQRVLELDPYSVEAHSKLGQTYQRLHQTEQAAIHLKRSRELIELRTQLTMIREKLQKDPDNTDLQQEAVQLRKALGQGM